MIDQPSMLISSASSSSSSATSSTANELLSSLNDPSCDLEDLNRTLYDIGAQDLLFDVWDSMEAEKNSGSSSHSKMAFPQQSQPAQQQQQQHLHSQQQQQQLVLKDRLLTDSVLFNGEEFPVKHEHSYSIATSTTASSSGAPGTGTAAGATPPARAIGSAGSDGDSMPASPISLQDDMENECYPCIPMQSASNQRASLKRKLPPDSGSSSGPEPRRSLLKHPVGGRQSDSLLLSNQPAAAQTTPTTTQFTRPKHPQSVLKQKPVITTTTILVATPTVTPTVTATPTTKIISSHTNNSPMAIVKTEPGLPSPAFVPSVSTTVVNRGPPIQTSLISSQPADSNGVLILTDEEKKTLISEGYPIPTRLPLTKAEEKSLKKIRRKIKNKISAQESRRKKKEFVDTLERQVEVASQALGEYKRKCEVLEKEKATLLCQLKSLRAVVISSRAASRDHNIKVEEDADEQLDQVVDIKMEEPSDSPDPAATSLCDGLGLD